MSSFMRLLIYQLKLRSSVLFNMNDLSARGDQLKQSLLKMTETLTWFKIQVWAAGQRGPFVLSCSKSSVTSNELLSFFFFFVSPFFKLLFSFPDCPFEKPCQDYFYATYDGKLIRFCPLY